MYRIFFYSCCSLLLLTTACHERTVKGDGKSIKDRRTVARAEKIKLSDDLDVEIAFSNTPSVEIEADENIAPLIETKDDDGNLIIQRKDEVNIESSLPIKITVFTPKISALSISGSGNIKTLSKFKGAESLKLTIAGSGDITASVNTPSVSAHIAGSGNIHVDGETQNNEIHISGSGDYDAEKLLSENTKVHIAGSGNVKTYVSSLLDVHIAGQGDVYYKGSPTIKQHIAGAGEIKKLD